MKSPWLLVGYLVTIVAVMIGGFYWIMAKSEAVFLPLVVGSILLTLKLLLSGVDKAQSHKLTHIHID